MTEKLPEQRIDPHDEIECFILVDECPIAVLRRFVHETLGIEEVQLTLDEVADYYDCLACEEAELKHDRGEDG
tara:strand:+ start:195 stop:413 length:219 start_codon:yes stop_codon:yes gene_type:complete